MLTVMFTGLLREPDRLSETLALLDRARRDGVVERVIVSTWEGEWAKARPGLGDKARFVDDVVESRALDDNGYGNVYAQKLHLRRALEVTAPGAWVFKTRTDVGLGDAILPWLAEAARTGRFDARPWEGLDRPLSHRLWVPWFHAGIPFGLADEAFCGLREDLERLNIDDERVDKLFDTVEGFHILLSPHVRRFVPIFGEAVILWDFLRLLGEPKLGPEAGPRDRILYRLVQRDNRFPFLAHRYIVEALYERDEFQRVIATYYDVLRRFFLFHNPPGQVRFQRGEAWPLVDACEPLSAGIMGRSYVDDTWLELVCAGRIEGSERVAAEVTAIAGDPTRLRSGLSSGERDVFVERMRESLARGFLERRPASDA